MSPLEAWLEKVKTAEQFAGYHDQLFVEVKQAIAVIEKLKEALEVYAAKHWVAECDHARHALAIDPDSLLRNSNMRKKK